MNIRSIFTGAAAFSAANVLMGLVLLGFALSQSRHRDHGFEDAVMALYVMTLQTLLNAVAFVAVTALSRRWRGLPPRRVAPIAGFCGIAACVAQWSGAWMLAMGAIGRVVNASAAVWLGQILPGLVCGGLAVAWVWMRSRRA